MFFYTEYADESNGVFICSKGSYGLTRNRLLHPYELDIRQAKLRKGLPLDESLLEARGSEVRNVIHPRYRQMMKVEETQMCIKAVQINHRTSEKAFGKSLLWRNGK